MTDQLRDIGGPERLAARANAEDRILRYRRSCGDIAQAVPTDQRNGSFFDDAERETWLMPLREYAFSQPVDRGNVGGMCCRGLGRSSRRSSDMFWSLLQRTLHTWVRDHPISSVGDQAGRLLMLDKLSIESQDIF